jgi:hypothetical protein
LGRLAFSGVNPASPDFQPGRFGCGSRRWNNLAVKQPCAPDHRAEAGPPVRVCQQPLEPSPGRAERAPRPDSLAVQLCDPAVRQAVQAGLGPGLPICRSRPRIVYYSAYLSTDGVHFTYIPGSEVALDLPGPLLGGLASDSCNSAQLSTATFTNLAEIPGVQPPPYRCPSGWNCADIGGAQPPGDDHLSKGTWKEIGGGGDIWSDADSFHFVWQTLSGDGAVTVQVGSQQHTSPWAKAGPMLRESTAPNSPYYAVFVTPGHDVAVQWRSTKGASTHQLLSSGATPVYLRVGVYAHDGRKFYSAYTSGDGTGWVLIPGSVMPLNLSEPLLAGFAITSHDQGVGSAVTLKGVSVAAGEFPPPGLVCPSRWTCADIGAATPMGSNSLSGGTWTVAGGGSNIWDGSDTFRYVWQSIPGNGGISAKVSSQTDSDAWAKSGVMLRASADPASPFYAVCTTPSNGIVVQARTAEGSDAIQVGAVSGSAPVYLEVTRTGTTFSAATSDNGTTWTPVPGSSLSIPGFTGAVLAGMAVCSSDPELLSTAVFNSVAVSRSAGS